MKKTPLPIATVPQRTTVQKVVRAIGSKALGKQVKSKRPSALDLKISLKYRR